KPFWNVRGLLLVTDRKFPAVAYLDDRAVHFTDWSQALTDLAVESSLIEGLVRQQIDEHLGNT
ncbi:hypothetical protein, partial [Streptomyces sp. N502]